MALFALFFFAGTLVGRGQIQVDLGQNALFKEIMGINDTPAPEMETEVITDNAPDVADFDFYNNLTSKNPDKDIEVTIKPSSKVKTKQVVKKNLTIIKPDEVDQAGAEDSTVGSDTPANEKKDKEMAEKVSTDKPKTETVPFTMKTEQEKPKTDSSAKPKPEAQDKAVKETAKKDTAKKDTIKNETAEKPKTDKETKAKTEPAVKTKPETAEKPASEKPKETELAKPAEKPKTAEKTDTAPKKFSLQVAALKNEADAETMAKKLKGLGFSAYTVKGGDKEIWYKVRVGTFKDRTEAENTITKLKSKNYDAFVISQ